MKAIIERSHKREGSREMKPSEVHERIGSLPYMKVDDAEYLHEFFEEHSIRNCLELGFYHGVSSAYIAAKMSEVNGHLTTIDRVVAKERKPDIGQILCQLNLSSYVTVLYAERSYTWELMKLLSMNSRPSFDFAYVDGGHGWDDTALAFFLVSQLLGPKGWIVFDDLGWTLANSSVADQPWALRVPEEERRTPTVSLVYDLLVRKDDKYHNHFVRGRWGFAQRRD